MSPDWLDFEKLIRILQGHFPQLKWDLEPRNSPGHIGDYRTVYLYFPGRQPDHKIPVNIYLPDMKIQTTRFLVIFNSLPELRDKLNFQELVQGSQPD